MKSKHYIFTFILVLLINFCSCTKTEILPNLKGNMVGYVYTFEEYVLPNVLTNNNRVFVEALGTKETYYAISDENGRFEFHDIPAGTYELHFLKDGYGTLKQFNIQHLGGEPTVLNSTFDHSSYGSAFFLHGIPTTEIFDVKIENNTLSCSIAFNGPQPEAIYIQVYMSRIESFETKSSDLILTNIRLGKNGDRYSGHIIYSNGFEMYSSLPFQKGEQIFFRVCASPYYGASLTLNQWGIYGIDAYFDYEKNQYVYPSLGKESDENSFIVP